MLTNILRAFGLTEKEIRVVQKTVEAGPQPASTIARLAELPRNTTRSILDELVKKGIMVKSKRANTQYYGVERKENLIRAVQYRRLRAQEEADRQLELLENYGDELSSRQWAKSRPRITFYEGTSGLEKVYEDTLTAKNGIRSWASFEGMHEAMPDYFTTYYDRRAAKNIHIRSIHPDSPLARERQKYDAKELRESKLVPSDRYRWIPEIQVYDNKVNIASWKEKLGIIIESPEIASALAAVFDLSFAGPQHATDQAPPPRTPDGAGNPSADEEGRIL